MIRLIRHEDIIPCPPYRPMNNTHTGRNHRGIIGVESAIVLIAFVIVAAALSFVVLNMGFSTTQQAKTTIASGVGDASSSMHISGEVLSATDVPRSRLNATQFPVKVVSGGSAVNLNATLATLRLQVGSTQYDNILTKPCVLTSTTYTSLQAALTAAVPGCINVNPIGSPGTAPTNTRAVIYWTIQKNTNEVLDEGEHANIVIVYNNADRPTVSQLVTAELIVTDGPALTMSRSVGPITDKYTSMG